MARVSVMADRVTARLWMNWARRFFTLGSVLIVFFFF